MVLVSHCLVSQNEHGTYAEQHDLFVYVVPNIEKRLKWYGHVRRMKEEHTLKRMPDGHDILGKRRREQPNLRWNDACKRDTTEAGLKEDNATNRAEWRKRKLISDAGDSQMTGQATDDEEEYG